MANSNDVLKAVEHLTEKLYGKNGFEGDIPGIKGDLKALNHQVSINKENIVVNNTTLYGKKGDAGLVKTVGEHNTRIWKLAVAIATISATVGGGVAGLVQWLG